MIRDDDHWLELADSFYSAAIGECAWETALEKLAAATGSRSGELIGIGAGGAIPFNILTNIDPSFQDAFLAVGGGDPAVNPRIRLGSAAPVLKVITEADFVVPSREQRSPMQAEFDEFVRRWDVPSICLTPLEKRDELVVGLAVVRSRREGHIRNEQRAAFTALAPHVRAAVRTHLALGNEGAALIVGVLDALSIAAFICDRRGRVRSLTPAAENLVSRDTPLRLVRGELRGIEPDSDKQLADAIAEAARFVPTPSRTALRTVILRGKSSDAAPLVLDIVALPKHAQELLFTPRLLVVARGEHGTSARKAAILQAAYGLTAAETDIALHLAAGKKVEAIAAVRGATVGTVRIQIKSILAKVGVRRQTELLARLAGL